MNDEANARVADLLDAYLRALEAGEAPDREAILARHPDLAPELSAALYGIEFVCRASYDLTGRPCGDAVPGGELGDYRLLREVGRGGMAVVYEAEQISLQRRVALKVLPFAAVLDPKQLRRFRNEALAAAQLQHPHIVPVYGVGCQRGVHYYAMQYVDGQSLAQAIRDMREGGAGDGPRTPISSHGSNREGRYVRMAAALGVQAADALDHAHQLGIVHRDVKPANLLLDAAGTLRIADFGLARSIRDVGLTITGELLGTVRYMSPEQAQARRVPLDHRTDVYSLGATLYELLTLEPAFPGDDPQAVMQAIASRDPVPARKLNPALPADLETVLLKAMEKDPAARYATARDMADDLGRYLADRPVLARRPSLASRAARWSRRRRGLVATSMAVLAVGFVAVSVEAARVRRDRQRTRANLDRAEANLCVAIGTVLAVSGIVPLADAPAPEPSRRDLLEAALQAYEKQPQDVAVLHRQATILHALHRYEEALAVLDRARNVQPQDAVTHVWRAHMLWHLGRSREALGALDRALDLEPGRADAHEQRGLALFSLGRFEDALAAHDRAIGIEPGSAAAHLSRGRTLEALGRFEEALAACDRAVEIAPDDPGAHGARAGVLLSLGHLDEAIHGHLLAVRLGPAFAGTHRGLGDALRAVGDLDGAIAEYREAIRLEPDHAGAHGGLAAALGTKGDLDSATRELREAMRLRPQADFRQVGAGLARVYAEAFAEAAAPAEDLESGHRYAAALAALAAGAREDGAEWRARALAWLRADLAAREKAGLAATLEGWKLDPGLAGVRDRVGELPDAERAAWTRLWADVEAALTRERERR